MYEIVKTSGVYDAQATIVVNFTGTATLGLGANVVADASRRSFHDNADRRRLLAQARCLRSPAAASPPLRDAEHQQYPLAEHERTSRDLEDDGNRNTLIGGGPVTPTPGPVFRAVGTGDFNGAGNSDILWQNRNTGQASIWEMSGSTLLGGGPVTPNPGPAWHAVGTGDFNGDGKSDILWQNTNTGQASIWEMNGNTLLGGGPVTPNPGTAWKAVGTGDFNKDGHSDILWQNTNTGQISIWEMNSNTLIGGGPVSAQSRHGLASHQLGRFQKSGFSNDILLAKQNHRRGYGLGDERDEHRRRRSRRQ